MTDDDPYPTKEELEQDAKDLFGDQKVIQFPKKEEKTTLEEGVLQWNKIYATVMYGGVFKVIDESIPNRVQFLDKKHWIDKHSRDKITIQTQDPNGNIKFKFEPRTKHWLEHPKSRQYRNVIFDPKCERNLIGGSGVDYNLWPGIATKSKRGQCYSVLQYIRYTLCHNNKEHYRWLMAWCAHMVQRPWEKPETAVAIQGEEEGTGKTFFPLMLGRILDGIDPNRWPKLYFTASNAKLITGDFSGHLEYCILLHSEECFSAENERENSIIKNIISEEYLPINAKFKEAKLVKSYIRVAFTGNPEHIIKAGQFARRFLVLEISNRYQQNNDYFKGLLHVLNNGGYEALMYYLIHYPIDKFNLRVAPKTIGLSRQKIMSDKETEFWHDMLHEGELSFIGTNDGKYYEGEKEYMVIKYKLFGQFQRYMGRRPGKDHRTEVSFGMKFSQFFPLIRDGMVAKDRDGKNMKMLRSNKFDGLNCYIIPSLRTCRRLFDIYLGKDISWPENNEWEEKSFGND